MRLTSNAREELSGKVLDLAVWEWHKLVCFQKVKDTLSE
jgi:hypothetical protein